MDLSCFNKCLIEFIFGYLKTGFSTLFLRFQILALSWLNWLDKKNILFALINGFNWALILNIKFSDGNMKNSESENGTARMILKLLKESLFLKEALLFSPVSFFVYSAEIFFKNREHTKYWSNEADWSIFGNWRAKRNNLVLAQYAVLRHYYDLQSSARVDNWSALWKTFG